MKPDDIEQWAWDEADDTTYNIETDGHGSIEYTAARIGIARLVMRVRSQAFEEAAEEARKWLLAADASEKAADLIPQAIRQHSQKGGEK